MRLHRLLVLALAAIAAASIARPAHAQADVISGVIVGPDKKPIENVNVTVSLYDGSLNRGAKTDKNGRFRLAFPDGTGDYWVSLSALGYLPRRYEVKRLGDEDILIADASLSKNVTTLDAVHTTASRQRPPRVDNSLDIGGNERTVNTNNLTLDQLGDLSAMAASLPGVTYIPGVDGGAPSFSVFGLDPSQNLTTIDGVATSASNLPRDANVSASLSTGSYDVSQGGASGATLSLRLAGGNDFYARRMSSQNYGPFMQWTTPAAVALQPKTTYDDIGGAASGPIKFDKIFYASSFQLSHSFVPLQTLLNTSPLGFEGDGIASDSVTRLLGILQQRGVPTAVGGIPTNSATTSGSVTGRFDFTPPSATSGHQFSISYNGGGSMLAPTRASATTVPAYGGTSGRWSSGVSSRSTDYFGCCVLSETNVGFSASRSWASPYLDIPAGRVLVSSPTFADGTPGTTRSLSFGGNPSLNSGSTTSTLSYRNMLSWFSSNNKHRIKFTTELTEDAFWENLTSNELGTFTYNSLADVQNGTPESFTRQLTPHTLSGNQLRGGTSLGDAWRPSTDFQLQYGVRLDANHFNSAPEFNPTVEELFGLKNSFDPNRVYASPRVGFSWTYGNAQQVAGLLGAARTPRAVVRGGIGVFQSNTQTAQAIVSGINANGLPSGLQQLTCIGAAVPTPLWSDYAANEASIPTECADGTQGTVFANTAPSVSLFAPNFVQPRSVRGNIQWSGATLRNFFYTTLNYTESVNLNATETADLNFAPRTRFTLANEGSRPVFVNPTSIVPASGAVALGDERITSAFSGVSETRSDGMQVSKQATLSLSPIQYSSTYSWNVSYTHLDVDNYYNGFRTNTDGNPLEMTWARAPNDYHHQLQAGFSYTASNAVTINLSGRFQSGSAYTPLVSGDINGDGYSNDRAFVFDPNHSADPAVASAMQTLMASGASGARACLNRQIGAIAAENSCEGPWNESLSMSMAFNSLKLRLPQRAVMSLSVSNLLGGADLLLHGSNHLQGWGQPAVVDQNLLYVRGFNQSTDEFTYQVNPQFGSIISTPHQTTQITFQVSVDVGPARERQSLTQLLDRGRATPGAKTSAASIKQIYGSGGVYNPMAQLLRESDSLKLTTDQADSIAAYNRWFTTRLDSIWTPIAERLALLPDKYDQSEAYRAYRTGREQSFDLLIQIAPTLSKLLSGDQKRMLPPLVSSYLDPHYLELNRASTSGGSAIGLPGGGEGVR